MKKNVIIFSIIIVLIIFILPYFLDDKVLSGINFSISFISGLSSFITLVIAVLLYSKYGVDKTIKDKNLEATLSLLAQIKKTTIRIENKGWMLQYRPTTFSMVHYEESYPKKLVFSEDYWENISELRMYSDNLFLPKEIKQKLDLLLPFTMGQSSSTLDIEEYGKVKLGATKSNEWKYDNYNNESITLYDYFLKWEDLISSIQEWCKSNSDSHIDLNIN